MVLKNESERKLLETINTQAVIEQLQIDGITLNYLVCGSGPNLLLLHGANMGWGQWYNNIADFSKYFTVYALDLPGSGNSTLINPDSIDFEKHVVETVKHFIENKKLSKVNIVSHSFGSWVTLRLLLSYGNLIDKVVLISPLGFSQNNSPKQSLLGIRFFAKLFAKTVMKPSRNNIKKFLESGLSKKVNLREEFINYYTSNVSKNILNHPFLFINRLSGVFKVREQFVLIKQLSNIKHKVLILVGENDSIVPLSKKHIEAYKLIPNSKIEIFLESGHIPFIEDSGKFNELVVDFLTK